MDAMLTPRRKLGGFERLCIMAALILLAAIITLRFFYAPYWVPAGSMKPSLLVGDYVIGRAIGARDVNRGDVVIFRHPTQDVDFIKRVVGMPGDQVQMRDGKLLLNGIPVAVEDVGPFEEAFERQGSHGTFPVCMNTPSIGGACAKEMSTETLPEGKRYAVLNIRDGAFDNTQAFTVPEGQFFVLGDNRDNSLDSRGAPPQGVGFVPAENIHHRAVRILFSYKGTSPLAFWRWREGRFFEAIP